MADVKIPQLPPAIGLDGTELLEIVQGGVSKYATAAMFNGLSPYSPVLAEFLLLSSVPLLPESRVLAVAARLTLTDGGALGNATLDIASNSVANAYLAQMAAGTVKANVSGVAATPADATLAELMNGIFTPAIVTAAGAYNVANDALFLVINKTDGADVTLPALASKVGPVKIVAEQGTAHSFNVVPTDGTIMGLSAYPFSNDWASVTFYPYPAGNVWMT